ncbi:MAG: FprA family A-type flavoprotein [Eubacterium sp.]|nr:FprA family A-type flavoprotein [Eubacterium sp.]
MSDIKISDSIKYIGTDDHDIDLFESQYVVPNGMAYNSYLILDDKVAIMDSVDARKKDEWLKNLKNELGERKPDYIIVQHLEPDHSGSLEAALKEYPDMKIVTSQKSAGMLSQFTEEDYSSRVEAVGEGDKLSLGNHELTFVMAPMVHWPEVMVSYESSEKVLFAADAFGKFGTLDTDEDWACEARRYYFNIVGKYGAQAQALLKKAAGLDIQKICSLHGPILPDKEPLSYYIDKYQIWSTYSSEDDGVFVAYTSIHGNTGKAAKKLGEILSAKGAKKVVVTDLAREDIAESVEDAFRYDKIVFASATYDGGLFPVMEDFLYRLGHKGFQNKKAAIVDNGSWAPVAGKKIREKLEAMKNITICENTVSLKSTLKPDNIPQLEALADELLG